MGGLSLATKGMLVPPCREGIDSTSGILFGEIEIEPDRWQLIAMAQETGYWDSSSHIIVNDFSTRSKVNNFIINQLTDKYVGGGESIGDYVEVANTYFGDINAFYTWQSGSPPPDSSPNNFPMVYVDGSRKEIAGIWIKSVASITMIIEWDAR